MIETEEWRPIDFGYLKYEVSSEGRVRSFRYGRWSLLKGYAKEGKYVCYSLAAGYRKSKLVRGHQLVAMAFLGHTPCGFDLVVNHKDFNKHNNRVSNLEIVTTRENTSLKSKPHSSKYTGVTWNKSTKKWRASINIGGEYRFIGGFINEIDASNAYQAVLSNPNAEIINRCGYNKTSVYKGVSYDKDNNKWVASIYHNKKTLHIGRYNSEYEAYLGKEAALKCILENRFEDIVYNKKQKTSKFKGVYKVGKKKYSARIYIKGKSIYLGTFTSEYDAKKSCDNYIYNYNSANS